MTPWTKTPPSETGCFEGALWAGLCGAVIALAAIGMSAVFRTYGLEDRVEALEKLMPTPIPPPGTQG